MQFLQEGKIAVAEVMGTPMQLVLCNPETNPVGLEVTFQKPGAIDIYKRAHMEPGSLLIYMEPDAARQFLAAVTVRMQQAQAAS